MLTYHVAHYQPLTREEVYDGIFPASHIMDGPPTESVKFFAVVQARYDLEWWWLEGENTSELLRYYQNEGETVSPRLFKVL